MCSAIQPCLAREIGADPQSETFLAEENVAAVARADRNDRVVLWEMADEPAFRIEIEQRVHAAVPFRVRVFAEPLHRDFSHARHDPHAEHDVDGIGDFEADFGERRIRRPHDVGNDEHRPPAHRAFQQAVKFRVGFRGLGPVIGRAGFLFRRRADESELLDPRDVVRIRAMQIGAGSFSWLSLSSTPCCRA